MQEAFSLLAYADPWNSPVGGQLEPSGREPVCAALNSAILGISPLSSKLLSLTFLYPESKNLPGRPPLEISLAHSAHLLKLMSHRYQYSFPPLLLKNKILILCQQTLVSLKVLTVKSSKDMFRS